MFWALGFVALSSVGGALLGLLLGATLALLIPDYYRGVFTNGDAASFNPLAVGAGLGTTQGLAGGAAVGVGICAIYFWYRARVAMRR